MKECKGGLVRTVVKGLLWPLDTKANIRTIVIVIVFSSSSGYT